MMAFSLLCGITSRDLPPRDGCIVMELAPPSSLKMERSSPQFLSPFTPPLVYEGLHPHGEGGGPVKLRDIMPGQKKEDFHFQLQDTPTGLVLPSCYLHNSKSQSNMEGAFSLWGTRIKSERCPSGLRRAHG